MECDGSFWNARNICILVMDYGLRICSIYKKLIDCTYHIDT